MAYYQTPRRPRFRGHGPDTRSGGFLDVSTTMYAVGSAVQQDVLRAQVEVARMNEEITRMSQDRVAMAARLNALLGRSATSPVSALELPENGDGELPVVDSRLLGGAPRPALIAGANGCCRRHRCRPRDASCTPTSRSASRTNSDHSFRQW
jgi:hypothetical protein